MGLKQKTSAVAAIVMSLAGGAEGIRYIAYYDPPGILTVCKGHTGPDVVKNKVYSPKECNDLFASDVEKAIAIVNRCVPGLPVHVQAAFADPVFNMGPTIVCDKKKSTAARMLAAGNIEDACRQLPRWNKAVIAGVPVALPGLTTRRAKDMDTCLNGAALYGQLEKD